ncbi:HNH endonuclease [Paenibacillus mesophilus]|uniref:HNH endonuclease signature motif containing protein n=1 Tax=Paenibacillus mesophilus TaxID=2582849 RepID=UPI00110D5538|nr:HNH endonuclease [Paenibacillus mesophilus]TMV47031.1 HNH endonuclease [Paenibacillus mesophilus]
MSIASFKEVAEISEKRLADSPLGKMAEGKTFEKPMSEYDKPIGLVCENLRNCPIEGNNGHWEGERGDSKWLPDRDYIPSEVKGRTRSNPDGITMGELLDKYGIEDGIIYKDGEPDFSEVSKGNVEIEPFSTERSDNFDKADIELANQKGCAPEEVAQWRKDNNYTWHECRDMRTMQKVPNEIHANFPHSGGISEAKKGNSES